MDHADATLVVLDEDPDAPLVFTLDRRGFETDRFRCRRTFEIVP